MSKEFTLNKDTSSGLTPVLRLQGRLDADGAMTLRETALKLKEEGNTQLIVDLSGLEFVASSGLGTLLLLTEEFTDVGGNIVFVAPTSDVLQVINLLNIDQFLTLVDSEEDARQAVLV